MAQGLFNLKQVNQAIQQGAWATGIKPTAVNYLVVAGAGAGGDNPDTSNRNGGGGAGGLLTGDVPVAAGTSYTVTIGAGSGRFGTAGTASVFGPISANGGGTGARFNNNVSYTGGSGGGGSSGSSFVLGAQGIAGQGNAGGNGVSGSVGGGGGGAATPGQVGYAGGIGFASAISGTVTTYAGGGGATGGSGGAGGGGAGNGTDGTANTGGGGGAGQNYGNAGVGGSGIVILSYPDTYAAAASTTGSPTVSTSGSGSLSFNGTTQYLSFANTTVLQLSGDFTIEGWFYISGSTSNNQIAISKWSSPNGYILYYDAAQSKYTFVNNAVTIASSTTQSFGQYYHLAVTKSGNNYVLYVNGTSVGTASSSTTPLDSATQLEIGRNSQSSSNWLNGYASNVRIVKGTAVYTGNFTPSTTPLTAVANTSLLLNTVSGAPYADSSTNSLATNTTTSLVGSWNASSPFTVTGYKNRVYTWTSSGSITF